MSISIWLWPLTAIAATAAIIGAAPRAAAQVQSSNDNALEEEIVVTGVPLDATPGELAQSVSVLGGEALDLARAATLGETLARELGVSSSFFGAGAARPIVRGLAGARVRTLEDGIDSMDAASVSDDHAVAVDALVADQIEIFRGPTTLLYGSGAIGGVVNTVTSRIPERVPDALGGGFELRADSVADGRAAAVRFDGGSRQLAWHFDAARSAADDYEIPGAAELEHEEHAPGIVENSAVESDSAAVGVSWIGDNAFFGIAVSGFATLYGVPGHHYHEEEGGGGEPGAEEDTPVRVDLDQTRVDLKGGWSGLGSIERIGLRIGLNDYEHAELEGAEVGTRFTNDASEVRLELLHEPLGAWSGAFGVQIASREFAALGEEAFVPPVDTTSYGLFVVEERELGYWNIALGGRLETQEHEPSDALAGPRVEHHATSASFAAVRELEGGRTFVANVALAERPPVAEELYSREQVPHLATRSFQLGDAALREEVARHVDLGVRGSRNEVTWAITGFATDYDDFIFLSDTGAVVDELPVFAFTQAAAEFFGIEAELFAPIAEIGAGELDLRVFADFVRGELASGENLPRMPPRRYGVGFQYHNERFLAGIDAARHDAQTDTAPFEDPTAAYTMVDADFRWRVDTARGVPLDLFVRARNVGDQEARRHTSFVKDVAPLPGRNFALGVRARW